MKRSALSGVLAHISANLVVAVSTLLTPAALAPLLGLESYAFIAFYLHLAVLLLLFDLGLSGLLLRQLAEARARDPLDKSVAAAGLLGKRLERTYWGIGLCLALGLAIAARPIAEHWLNVSPSLAPRAPGILRIMVIAFVLQWPLFLYQNGLMGLGRQIEASVLSACAAVLRLAVCYVAVALTRDVSAYFEVLAACNLIITACAFAVYHRALSAAGLSRPAPALQFRYFVGRQGEYALTLALIMMLGYVLSSIDRLLAAKVLPLGLYAGYAIVCTLSQGISLGTSAVVGACLPRLVQAFSREDRRAYEGQLFLGQLAVCAVCVPIYVVVAFAPGPLYQYLAGQEAASRDIQNALTIHASGTLLHTLMVLLFAAHQSQQRLRGWLLMTCAIAAGALAYALKFRPQWGVVGLAYLWLSICAAQMLIGVSISFALRYHELSVRGTMRILAYAVQALGGIAAGYLAFAAFGKVFANFPLTAVVAAAASFIVTGGFLLVARKVFHRFSGEALSHARA
jgi:O-antigen/teichoic acid export membrane protein